mgnify:CR=1 FL=1
MKAITNKMPKTEDALNAETFGNLVVEVQGKKISNSNTGDPLDSWSSESAGDNNLAVFTTVPSTKNQFFTNYGSVVKEYNNLANVGNAGVGGRIIGDLYGEGMVLIPKTVAQNSFVLYTKSGYKGVERLNSNGQLTNGDIVRQKIAVRKDDLEKLISNLEEYGASKLKITHKSNIIILDVPTQNTQGLISKLQDIRLAL